jgi:hypothetical protein
VQSLAQSTRELRESVKEHDEILRGHASLIGDLVRIAAGHEQRMQRLEGHQAERRQIRRQFDKYLS